MLRATALACFVGLLCGASIRAELRVGAAQAEFRAEDSMIIGGGIMPARVAGQEGKLRAVAVVVEKLGSPPVAIVACDVLMMNRDLLDPVTETIEREIGIPATHVMIHCTHTHHAPSTATVHGYQRDELFCRRVQEGIVAAVRQAHEQLKQGPASFQFWLGEESSVGQNSRLLLSDNTIYWIGPHDDAVRPTGPFDPELPVWVFRGGDGNLRGVIFNHSTHTIGVRQPGKRSPAFYGLAAQELEEEWKAPVCFLQGASGSTHNLRLKTDEMVLRIKNAVRAAVEMAEERPVDRVTAIKRKFTYRIRQFDERREDQAVEAYCRTRVPTGADDIIRVFREQRAKLAPFQGQERTTWLQVILIGDVALVGVPAELFTRLGQEIKRRSPFRYTYVAELANDWIGYVPDRKAFDLGGYQTWTGLHSFADPQTGEQLVQQVVLMLRELQSTASR